jgi:DNA-binding LacI/PurR family transcriptional regulator
MTVEGRFFLLSVLDGVQSVLRERRLDLVALFCSAGEDQDEFLQRAVARRATDALIVTDLRRGDPRVDYLLDRQIPFVTLGQSGSARPYLWFDADIDQMATAAADRLCGGGHRSFAVFSADDGENFNLAFVEQFAARVAGNGLPTDQVRSYECPPNEESGYRLTLELIRAGNMPSALVLLSEPMTLGVYRALHENRVTPGTDIAIIGRDSPAARFLYPTLTRFQLPLHEFGVEVAHGLLDVMETGNGRAASKHRQLWQAALIEGHSD